MTLIMIIELSCKKIYNLCDIMLHNKTENDEIICDMA